MKTLAVQPGDHRRSKIDWQALAAANVFASTSSHLNICGVAIALRPDAELPLAYVATDSYRAALVSPLVGQELLRVLDDDDTCSVFVESSTIKRIVKLRAKDLTVTMIVEATLLVFELRTSEGLVTIEQPYRSDRVYPNLSTVLPREPIESSTPIMLSPKFLGDFARYLRALGLNPNGHRAPNIVLHPSGGLKAMPFTMIAQPVWSKTQMNLTGVIMPVRFTDEQVTW